MYPQYSNYKQTTQPHLDKIPTHWKLVRIKHVAPFLYGDSLAAEKRDDNGVIPVYGSNGVVGSHSHSNTHAPCLIIGRKGSYGKINYSEIPTFAIDTTFYVDDRNADADIRWLYYALQTVGLDTGSQDAAVPGLSREFAHEQWLPLTPESEQRTIANFLDRETATIDTLIAKKRELIARLQEKRTALISHAVTKGLDPSVALRDSGVEWLGEIPAHWEIIRSKWLFALRKTKAYISDRQITVSQKHGPIYQEDFVKLENRRVMEVIKGADILQHIEPNDFVISMRSFQGGIEYCKYRGSVSSAYVVLIPAESVHAGYFSHLLS